MADLTAESTPRPAELLLIEDSSGDVVLTREAFASAGLSNHLAVASDGEEALGLLRREGAYRDQRRPDLILLDLNLPRMDGREVLRAIRADADLRAIPVIILTSSSADIERLRAGELEASGYLVKPIDFDRLKDAVLSLGSFWLAFVTPPARLSAEPSHV